MPSNKPPADATSGPPASTGIPFAAIPHAIASDRRLTTTARLTVAALAYYAFDEGRCSPSDKRLADYVGCSVETMQRSLKSLEDQGLIRREKVPCSGTNQTSRVIVLAWKSDPSVLAPLPDRKTPRRDVPNLDKPTREDGDRRVGLDHPRLAPLVTSDVPPQSLVTYPLVTSDVPPQSLVTYPLVTSDVPPQSPVTDKEELFQEPSENSMRTLSISERAGGLGPLVESKGSGNHEAAESDEDVGVAWALERVAVAFPGDDSILEILPMWIRSWVRDGSSLIEIQDATVKALAKVRQASALVPYVKRCLDSAKLAPRAEAGPVAPISRYEVKRRALLDGFQEAILAAPSKARALEDEFDAWAASRRKEAPDAGE